MPLPHIQFAVDEKQQDPSYEMSDELSINIYLKAEKLGKAAPT